MHKIYLQAISEAVQTTALENNNMQIEQEHLLTMLLTMDESLIAQLLKKMEKDPQAVAQAVKQQIDKMPGVRAEKLERFMLHRMLTAYLPKQKESQIP